MPLKEELTVLLGALAENVYSGGGGFETTATTSDKTGSNAAALTSYEIDPQNQNVSSKRRVLERLVSRLADQSSSKSDASNEDTIVSTQKADQLRRVVKAVLAYRLGEEGVAMILHNTSGSSNNNGSGRGSGSGSSCGAGLKRPRSTSASIVGGCGDNEISSSGSQQHLKSPPSPLVDLSVLTQVRAAVQHLDLKQANIYLQEAHYFSSDASSSSLKQQDKTLFQQNHSSNNRHITTEAQPLGSGDDLLQLLQGQVAAREALHAQLEEVKLTTERATDALRDRLDATQAEYKRRSQQLQQRRAEAEKALIEASTRFQRAVNEGNRNKIEEDRLRKLVRKIREKQ